EVLAPGIRVITIAFMASEGSTPTMFNNGLAIGDLEFDGQPPPACLAPPVVTIFYPVDGLEVDAAQLTVTGIVIGKDIPPYGTMVVKNTQPAPNDLTPPNAYTVVLSGSGDVRTFSQPVSL